MSDEQHPDSVYELNDDTSEFAVAHLSPVEDELIVRDVIAGPSGAENAIEELVRRALQELDALSTQDRARADIHLWLGLVADFHLHDPRRALVHLEEAQRLDPHSLTTVTNLRRIYHQRRNWTMLRSLLDTEISLTPNPSRSAALYIEKGRILEQRLGRLDGAQLAYGEASRLAPGSRQALTGQTRVFQLRGLDQEVAGAVKQLASATSDRRLGSILLARAGRVFETHGDRDRARERYAAALLEDPGNVFVSLALRRLYSDGEHPSALVDLLLSEVERSADDEHRAHLLYTAARLCRDSLDQPMRALPLLARAGELLPRDTRIQEARADLLAAVGRFEELAELWGTRIESFTDEGERVAAHYQLGRILEERLTNEDAALAHYRRAVAIDPTYVPALQALSKLCHRREEWGELVTIGAQEVETIPDVVERACRLHALGELCEQRLADAHQAIEFHKRALTNTPLFAPSLEALERLYTVEGAWAELVELLEEQTSALEGPTRGHVLRRLGQLCVEKLGDTVRGIGFLEGALAALPEDRDTLRTLRHLHETNHDHQRVVELLDLEVAKTADDSLRLALMHKAATVLELMLGDVEGAVARYQHVLARAPTHSPSLQALGRIYHRLGQWEQVIALYQAEIAGGELPTGRVSSLLFKIGEIHHERLGDHERARVAYQKAAEVAPGFLPALHALSRLHQSRQEWSELVAVLEQRVRRLGDSRERAATLHAIGELRQHKLGDIDGAIDAYRVALEAHPTDPLALESLFGALGQVGRFREVVEGYVRAAATAHDRARKAQLIKAAAAVCEAQLGHLEQARALSEEALHLDPHDIEVLDALARIAGELGQLEALCNYYDRLALITTDPEDRIAFLYEAAALCEAYLPDWDPAPFYERILAMREEETGACDALIRIYAERGQLEPLGRVIDLRKELTDDPRSKVADLLSLAAIREQLNDFAGAAWAMGEARAISGAWLVERELRRLRERLGQWEHVAESLEREATAAKSPANGVACLLRAATLYQHQVPNPTRELSCLMEVLVRDPFHRDASTRVEQLLVQNEAWKELVEVLRRRLDAIAAGASAARANRAQVEVELLARIAWISREHLGRPLEAVAALRQSLQIDPQHLPTLLTLGDLHMELEQWKEAAEVYQRTVAASTDADVLRMANLRLGDLYSEKLREQQQAISSYQNVLALAPNDRLALSRLFELFRDRSDQENAIDVLQQLIESDEDTDRLVDYHIAAAEIHDHGFNDQVAAAEHLLLAQEIAPDHEEVVVGLSRYMGALGEWEVLSGAISTFLAALASDDQLRGIPYRLQLGDILHYRLGRVDDALQQYRAVAELAPNNTNAKLSIARLLAEQGRHDLAITEHRQIQDADPLNLESLDQMRVAWTRIGRHDLAHAAATLLGHIGDRRDPADTKDRRSRVPPPVRRVAPGADAAFDAVVVHPLEHPAGRRILALLAEAAHRIRPPRLTDWRIGKGDRLPTREGDPLRAAVDDVSARLGLEWPIDVYQSPGRGEDIELLLTDKPSIVIGSEVLRAVPAIELRGRLAQLLSYVRNRTWIAYGITGADLKLLIRAACLTARPRLHFEEDGEVEVQLSEMVKLIQRSLSRRTRRALEDLSADFLARPEPDFDAWARAMVHSAYRTALWLIGELDISLRLLEREDRALAESRQSPERYRKQLKANPIALDLMRFWMSEAFATLRSGDTQRDRS